ncbi:hypothetical protein TRAPUB_9931 [Trametes pubescens]|uniref:Uncharacterized protein n=1 Tax=Trametes pubescens TaxID=154538 RepID=A0A1M2W0W2_TRAPU|nr:hypothetical protein TRAPUB_9931 [Trametes pubescens]
MTTPLPSKRRREFMDQSPEALQRDLKRQQFNFHRASPKTPADEAVDARSIPLDVGRLDMDYRYQQTLRLSFLLAQLRHYEAGYYIPWTQSLTYELALYKWKTDNTITCLVFGPQGVVHDFPPPQPTSDTVRSNELAGHPSWVLDKIDQPKDTQAGPASALSRGDQLSDQDDDGVPGEDMDTFVSDINREARMALNKTLKGRRRVIPDFLGILVEGRMDKDLVRRENIIFSVEIKPVINNPSRRITANAKLLRGQVKTQAAYILSQNKKDDDVAPVIVAYGIYWTYAEITKSGSARLLLMTLEKGAILSPPAAVVDILKELKKLASDTSKSPSQEGSKKKERGSAEDAEPGSQGAAEPAGNETADPEEQDHEEIYMEQLLTAVGTFSEQEITSELCRVLEENQAGIQLGSWESKYALTLIGQRIQYLYPDLWRDPVPEKKGPFVLGKSLAQSIMESKIWNRERNAQLEKEVHELEVKLKTATDTAAGTSAGKSSGKGAEKGKAKEGGK